MGLGIFLRRKLVSRSVNISETTAHTLYVITWLAFIGFLSYFVLSILNLTIIPGYSDIVKYFCIIEILYRFINIFRCMALLAVITLRGKKRINRNQTGLENYVSQVGSTIHHALPFDGIKSTKQHGNHRKI